MPHPCGSRDNGRIADIEEVNCTPYSTLLAWRAQLHWETSDPTLVRVPAPQPPMLRKECLTKYYFKIS